MTPQTPHPAAESDAGPSTASVVLRHTRPGKPPHFDWLIEVPDRVDEHRLMSFRSPIRPDTVRCGVLFHLDLMPDHRVHYLQYEGEIADGRGRVERVASGCCNAFTLGSNPDSLSLAIGWSGGEVVRYWGLRNELGAWSFHRL